MNEKKYPWPVEYFKNVSYLYPWYLERVRLYYCRYTTLDLSNNKVKKAPNVICHYLPFKPFIKHAEWDNPWIKPYYHQPIKEASEE